MTRTWAAAILVAAALGLGACSGDEEATPTSGAPTTAETSEGSTSPTTTGEAPLSAEEVAWWRAVNRYEKRLRKQWERSGITITQAVMRRWAALFGECRKAVKQAGDPGRYAPAARPVDRACARLGKAKDELAVAIASTDAGGAVVTGSAEQAQFDRALNKIFELVGNALNDFAVAETQANLVEAEFGT
jgi:hypothetical protein